MFYILSSRTMSLWYSYGNSESMQFACIVSASTFKLEDNTVVLLHAGLLMD